MSVTMILLGLALIFLIAHAVKGFPLWPSVLCLIILGLLQGR